MSTTLLWAVISGLLIWSGITTLLLIRLQRTLRSHAVKDETLRTDMRALCNAAVVVGERLGKLERSLLQLDRKQSELGKRQQQLGNSDSGEQSFEQAIKLAKKGAAVEELVELCGLSPGEAELLAMMQRLSADQG